MCNSAEEYYNNRTVADIMEDWGEQRDEWVTLVSVKDNIVRQFRHSNGNQYFTVEYKPEYGVVNFPDGFEKKLEGKSLEQQMEHYAISESRVMLKTAYGEITNEDVRKYCTRLSECKDVLKLIVRDRQLVGVVYKGYYGTGHLLPYNSICTYYACDNEGSGNNEREDYAYLLCVPE